MDRPTDTETDLSAHLPQTTRPRYARPPQAVTWRSVLLALALLPVSCYWQYNMEVVRSTTHPSTVSLFFNVVFILLVVTLISRGLGRLHPSLGLNRGELLFVYTILTIGAALCGCDMLDIIVPMLSYSFRYGDGGNGWNQTVNPHLPRTMFISDPKVYDPFYNGNSSVWSHGYWKAWLPVIGMWTLFLGALLWVMLCINTVMRRAWTDNERLTYPIVQLPLQITDEAAWTKCGLAGNKWFWVGFAIAGTIDMVNSLNLYFPQIPSLGTPGQGMSQWDLASAFTEKPWNAITWLPVTFFPFLIGLGMLLPTDFLLSIFVFYWFWKLQKVASVALAFDQTARFPYIENQAFGAYMSFCIGSLWVSRHYLRDVWRRATFQSSPLDDRDEPMPYAVAVWGGLAGVALLCGFAHYLGMSYLVAVAFFVLYFALALAVTRMRAELGTPIHDLHFTGPEMILTRTLGTQMFGPSNLTALALFFSFNRAYRSNPMPQQLESFKLAEQARTGFRRWTIALAILQVVAVFVGMWVIVAASYQHGAAARMVWKPGREAFDTLGGWLSAPKGPDGAEFAAILVGIGVSALLQWLRIAVGGFPLHPLAFAVTSSWQVNLVWMPLTIAYVIKSLLLRFGGLRAFRGSLPFFFGLMLGQFVVGGLWNVLGTLMDLPTYKFWD